MNNMRLGSIQKRIVGYISRYHPEPVYIGSGLREKLLYGYDLEQVESSLDRLVKRNIIVKESGHYFRLVE